MSLRRTATSAAGPDPTLGGDAVILDGARAEQWPPPPDFGLDRAHAWWSTVPLDDPTRMVEDALSALSQIVFAASWLSNIERDAWDMLTGTAPIHVAGPYGTADDAQAQLHVLREHALNHGWWPVYDAGDDLPYDLGRRVPLTTWISMQQAHRHPESPS